MKKIYRKVAVFTLSLTLAMPSFAGGLPVIDLAAAANAALQLAEWAKSIAQQAWQTAQQERQHIESDATAMMTGYKTAMAQKTVAEGVAEWQVKEQVRRENVRLLHSLEQPETTCATMAQAGKAVELDATVNSAVHASTAAHVLETRIGKPSAPGGTSIRREPINTNSNSTQQVVKTYDYVVSNFCSPSEAKAGRCEGVNQSEIAYPGGDIRADLLFGDGSGPTGAGNGSLTITTEQDVAVEAFISNIIDSMSPEMLRNPAWEKTEAGRKYVLMVRQYAAFMSLSGNSLHSIQKNHLIDPKLGISRMDAADKFVKLKWSKESISDLATATEPHKILREIAQLDSYRLWIEFQNLAAGERQEAIMAGQLALMTNQSFGPGLAAQKQAATSKGNSLGG